MKTFVAASIAASSLLVASCESSSQPELRHNMPAEIVLLEAPSTEYDPTTFSSKNNPASVTLKQCVAQACEEYRIDLTRDQYAVLEADQDNVIIPANVGL